MLDLNYKLLGVESELPSSTIIFFEIFLQFAMTSEILAASL